MANQTDCRGQRGVYGGGASGISFRVDAGSGDYFCGMLRFVNDRKCELAHIRRSKFKKLRRLYLESGEAKYGRNQRQMI